MADITLAIDVGGTKIAVGLADPDGALVHTATRPTPHGDAEAVWAVVERLITETTADTAVRGVGIASAGPIQLSTGTVSPLNIRCWREFPIVDRVAPVTRLAAPAEPDHPVARPIAMAQQAPAEGGMPRHVECDSVPRTLQRREHLSLQRRLYPFIGI